MSDAAFLTLQVVSVALATAAGAGVLAAWARRAHGLGVGALVLAGVAAAAATAVLCAVGHAGPGMSGFGSVRLVFLTGAISVPLLGAAVLLLHVARRTPATRGALLLAATALCGAPLAAHMTWIEPRRLVVERCDVPLAARCSGSTPVRIAVLADLQCDAIGEHERAAVDALLAERPDLILVPGDTFQGYEHQWAAAQEEFLALMRRLDAPGGVWFVPGDVDARATVEALETRTAIRVLRNEIAEVRVGDRVVRIAGSSRWPGRGFLDALETTPGDDVRILLTHAPDLALALRPSSRVDLVVAGHTHGGQIVLPLFGPPMTLSRVPRAVAAGGLHELDGRRVYVSRGVGMERKQAPRVRLLCPPEVSILTLRGGAEPGR